MVRLVNRAKMTTATTGTGTITLGSASGGFQTLAAAGVADGDTVRYVIEEGTAFELGSGVFSSAGGTLTRNPSESSAGGGAITLAGSALVFVTAASTDIQQPPAEGPFVDGDKTKLDGAFPASAIPAGTKMLFAQTTAPTGWTKDTTHNNKALRVVNGTAGSGGSLAFTTAFGNRTTGSTAAGGTVAGHSLTRNQNAAHNHSYHVAYKLGGGSLGVNGNNLAGASADSLFGTFTAIPAQGTSNDGASEAHAHGFTGTAHNHNLEMSVQYVDIIIATKG